MSLKSKFLNGIHSIVMMTKEEKIKPVIIPTDKEQLLKDKVVLITGGSSGIGYSIAETSLNSGAKVIIASSNENKLNNALNSLAQIGGGNVKGIVIDVKNTESLPAKVNEASKMFKENRIDVLVNSAGIISKSDFFCCDEKEFDDVMNTNSKGTFFMSQAVAKLMIEKKIGGHILNVTSSSALRPAWTPYQMSKWTVKGFTKGLADTLIPYGIIVNAIAPGPTVTPMLGKADSNNIFEQNTPAKRFSMPQEIAALAVFMMSDAGNMIVGDTYYMTGGSGTISLHH